MSTPSAQAAIESGAQALAGEGLEAYADQLRAAGAAVAKVLEAAQALIERTSKDRAGIRTVYASDVTQLEVAIAAAGGAA